MENAINPKVVRNLFDVKKSEVQEEAPVIKPSLRRDDISIKYYSNGEINIRSEYKDGLKHGLYEKFYKEGSLFIRSNYYQGKLNGIFFMYYKSGSIMQTCNYVDGKLHGMLTINYGNGMVKEQSYYSGDLKEGATIKYGINGEVVSNFINSKRKRSWTPLRIKPSKISKFM